MTNPIRLNILSQPWLHDYINALDLEPDINASDQALVDKLSDIKSFMVKIKQKENDKTYLYLILNYLFMICLILTSAVSVIESMVYSQSTMFKFMSSLTLLLSLTEVFDLEGKADQHKLKSSQLRKRIANTTLNQDVLFKKSHQESLRASKYFFGKDTVSILTNLSSIITTLDIYARSKNPTAEAITIVVSVVSSFRHFNLNRLKNKSAKRKSIQKDIVDKIETIVNNRPPNLRQHYVDIVSKIATLDYEGYHMIIV